jgi:3-methyladenine DNA glycosylase AlkD
MPDVAKVIKSLKQEVVCRDRPENRVNYQQFFKEKLAEPEGLRAAVLRLISGQVYRQFKDKSPTDLFQLCDQLLDSGERYSLFFAFDWALKQRRHYQPREFKRFENWLKKYVNNWGACDHLGTGPLGCLLVQFPDLVSKTHPWRKSKSRWLRRAAAVSLIVPVRQGLLRDEVFGAADTLLMDQDDMVQKGYGWMLKEATKRFPDDVFAYVMKHKANMPRTALRYAIEKMPEKRRKQAMAK